MMSQHFSKSLLIGPDYCWQGTIVSSKLQKKILGVITSLRRSHRFAQLGDPLAAMSTLTRSFTPLLRTTRFALRQRKGINPVEQVFGRDHNGARGLATSFERTKPHVNIGIFYPRI